MLIKHEMSNDDDNNDAPAVQTEFSIEEIHQILGEGDAEKLRAVQAFLDGRDKLGITVVRQLPTVDPFPGVVWRMDGGVVKPMRATASNPAQDEEDLDALQLLNAMYGEEPFLQPSTGPPAAESHVASAMEEVD